MNNFLKIENWELAIENLKRGLGLVQTLGRVALLALLVAVALPQMARAAAEVDPVVTGLITGAPALLTVTNTTVNSTASSNLDFPPNKDLTLTAQTQGGVGNLTLGFNLSQDGQRTNFTTVPPVTAVFLLTTSNSIASAIISRTNLVGFKSLRWDQSIGTNATGTLIRKVQWSWQ